MTFLGIVLSIVTIVIAVGFAFGIIESMLEHPLGWLIGAILLLGFVYITVSGFLETTLTVLMVGFVGLVMAIGIPAIMWDGYKKVSGWRKGHQVGSTSQQSDKRAYTDAEIKDAVDATVRRERKERVRG